MTLITPSDRIFVAGHRGMAGSAIVRALEAKGYTDLLTAGRDQLDLRDAGAVELWFANHSPDVVVLAAAKVGGILANSTLSRRLPARQPQDPDPCDRERLAPWGPAIAVSGQQLHLSEVRRAADPGGGAAQRGAGAHQ